MSIVFDSETKVIGHNTVIDHINCTMQAGSITGLKGINGSGKTMMMRLIAGLIYPTEGRVIVEGKVVGKEIGFPPSLGLMLENPAFLDAYSGYENLKLLVSPISLFIIISVFVLRRWTALRVNFISLLISASLFPIK